MLRTWFRHGARLAILLAGACRSSAAPDALAPSASSPPAAALAAVQAPVIVPSTGDVVWMAQRPGGEFALRSFEQDFMASPSGAIRACHARGREAQANEAGWEVLRVVVVSGRVTDARMVRSQGLPAPTLDCISRSLVTSYDPPDASGTWPMDPRPKTLDLYVGLR
jgi:hypothetical protein